LTRTLFIIDEAARVSDQLYNTVRPFLSATAAVHGRPGRLVVASTPFGKRGWFYEAWQQCEKARAAYEAGRAKLSHRYSGDDAWLNHHYNLGVQGKVANPPFQSFRVTADQCPRITKEFLDEELAAIGQRWFSQEYHCEFTDNIDSVFSHHLVTAMVQSGEGERKLWFE
jgi:hypothetical protein